MKRPNILHLFTDQHRVDGVQALGGHSFLQTPHLDRLCREGTVFTSAYTPVAECVPARACMITGQYADKTGCGSNRDAMPPETTPTLMSALRDGGYRTHGVGKCHFTPESGAMRGFETRDTMEEIVADVAGDDYLQYLKGRGFDHVIEPHGVRGEMYYVPQPSQLPEELNPTQWVGDRCLDFLREAGGSGRPWYLYAGFVHPHPPFAPPSPWHKLYRAPEMPLPHLPENLGELLCFINRFQNRYKYRDRGLDLNLVRCIRAYYYACISFIDYQAGRILGWLEENGELENTLILFSADHGELLGDFGSFGKRSFHDVSQRVPLVVRQPGRFPAGESCAAPASLVDLLPTFLSAAGCERPAGAEGRDLAALAAGEERGEPVYFHYARGGDAILGGVNEGWKYAWSVPDARGYLFTRDGSPEGVNRIGERGAGAGSAAAQALEEAVRSRAAAHAYSAACVGEDGQWVCREPKRLPSDPDEGLLYQDPPGVSPRLPEGYELDYPRENKLGL